MNITHDIIATNGVELKVYQAGDPANPTIVLSHGFPELAYSWRHQFLPLAEAGYHAVLVGEHLVTAGDPQAGVAALRRARRS